VRCPWTPGARLITQRSRLRSGRLAVHHFMWLDESDAGCPSCTGAADRIFSDEHFDRLRERGVAFAAIARAPWPKIKAYRDQHGWTFPFFSSYGSDFNYDFHVTLDESQPTSSQSHE
jgi:predicted dithiol-disulfide oxidoreductase (DUF899 family)